jgi:hypothetical protein
MIGVYLYILTVCVTKTLNPPDIQIRRVALLATRLSLRQSTLFTPSRFAQSVSEFFVDLPPVAEREYPNEPSFTIDFID